MSLIKITDSSISCTINNTPTMTAAAKPIINPIPMAPITKVNMKGSKNNNMTATIMPKAICLFGYTHPLRRYITDKRERLVLRTEQ